MQSDKEYPTASALIVIPEWAAEYAGRCMTCYYAKSKLGRQNARCTKHDQPVAKDYSCIDYAPAPELKDVERFWPEFLPPA
jgi:hypothetical protein